MEQIKGFSGLKRLAETIDREIEMLEKEVTFGLVVDTSGSKFSADIADDILEEVKTLKVDAEDLVQMVSERVSNMESFIEGLLHTAAEVEENVKQVENYAAQYGYVPQERCSLEEAYAEFLAAGSNPKSSVNEQSDDTGAVSSTTATSSVSAVNVVGVVDKKGHVDSPNLLTFGLSKKTLGQLGFKFKEDLSVAGPAGSRPIEEKKGKCELDSKLVKSPIPSVAKIELTPGPVADEVREEDDDDFSPVSILKTRGSPQTLQTSNFSFVEISPGLVVKRPSTRITPKFNDKDAISEINDSSASEKEETRQSPVAQKSQPVEVVASPDGTPPMPSLKTFKWVSGAVSSAKRDTVSSTKIGEIKPSPVRREMTQKLDDSMGSPTTPDLKTVDLRKLLKATKIESNKLVLVDRNEISATESPELPELSTTIHPRSSRSIWNVNKENVH